MTRMYGASSMARGGPIFRGSIKENLEGIRPFATSENICRRYLRRADSGGRTHPFQGGGYRVFLFRLPAKLTKRAAEERDPACSMPAGSGCKRRRFADAMDRWTLQAGTSRYRDLRSRSSQREFYRAVPHSERAATGKSGSSRAEGEIHRYVFNGVSQESLNGAVQREIGVRTIWRVEVLNGNDAPAFFRRALVRADAAAFCSLPRRRAGRALPDASTEIREPLLPTNGPGEDVCRFPRRRGDGPREPWGTEEVYGFELRRSIRRSVHGTASQFAVGGTGPSGDPAWDTGRGSSSSLHRALPGE